MKAGVDIALLHVVVHVDVTLAGLLAWSDESWIRLKDCSENFGGVGGFLRSFDPRGGLPISG